MSRVGPSSHGCPNVVFAPSHRPNGRVLRMSNLHTRARSNVMLFGSIGFGMRGKSGVIFLDHSPHTVATFFRVVGKGHAPRTNGFT